MKHYHSYLNMNLSLFGEGDGAGTAGQSGEGTEGVGEGDPDSQEEGKVLYGIQPEANDPVTEDQQEAQKPDLDAEFDELISGKFKDIYGKRVGKTVQSRLKGTKAENARLKGIVDEVGRRYGVKADDYDAVENALRSDKHYVQDYAMEHGITEEHAQVELENIALKQQLETEGVAKIHQQWNQEAQELKAQYPGFDFDQEFDSNPTFRNILASGVSVAAAYRATHDDEITPAIVNYAARRAKQEAAQTIAAGMSRPRENGMNQQGSVQVKSRVDQLTDNDLDAIFERLNNGETLTFG